MSRSSVCQSDCWAVWRSSWTNSNCIGCDTTRSRSTGYREAMDGEELAMSSNKLVGKLDQESTSRYKSREFNTNTFTPGMGLPEDGDNCLARWDAVQDHHLVQEGAGEADHLYELASGPSIKGQVRGFERLEFQDNNIKRKIGFEFDTFELAEVGHTKGINCVNVPVELQETQADHGDDHGHAEDSGLTEVADHVLAEGRPRTNDKDIHNPLMWAKDFVVRFGANEAEITRGGGNKEAVGGEHEQPDQGEHQDDHQDVQDCAKTSGRSIKIPETNDFIVGRGIAVDEHHAAVGSEPQGQADRPQGVADGGHVREDCVGGGGHDMAGHGKQGGGQHEQREQGAGASGGAQEHRGEVQRVGHVQGDHGDEPFEAVVHFPSASDKQPSKPLRRRQGIKPDGLVQQRISGFLNRFPNLKNENNSSTFSNFGPSEGPLTGRLVGLGKRKCNQMDGPEQIAKKTKTK